MINQNNKIFLLVASLLSIVAFVSCSQKSAATIVIRGDKIYDKNNSYGNRKYQDYLAKKTKIITPRVNEVEVIAGDTVYSISRSHDVSIRDLVSQNNLNPPYNLKIGSKIVIPKARQYQVVTGDTLYSIARSYGMSVNDLIKLNKMSEPYVIRVGSQLQISDNNLIVSGKADANSLEKRKELAKPKEADQVLVVDLKDQKISKKLKSDDPIVVEKNNQFIWPAKGSVISNFGPKTGGLYNDGINIRGKIGDPVKSTEEGVVAYVGNELRGYGNLIIIKHPGGWISAYAHLNKAKVVRGDKVKKGDIIAEIGSTGNVNSPQLYFGIRKGKDAVNPEIYLADAKGKQSTGDDVGKVVKMRLKKDS